METGENFDPRLEYAIKVKNDLTVVVDFINDKGSRIIPSSELSTLDFYVKNSNDFILLDNNINTFLEELKKNQEVLNQIRPKGKNFETHLSLGFPTVKGTRKLIDTYSNLFNPKPHLSLESLYNRNLETCFESIDNSIYEINTSNDISEIQKNMDQLNSTVALVQDTIFLGIKSLNKFNKYVTKIHSFKETHPYVAFNKYSEYSEIDVKGYKIDWTNYQKKGIIAGPVSNLVKKFANTLSFP